MALDFLECGWRWGKDRIGRKASAGADLEHLSALLWIASDSPSCGRPLRQKSKKRPSGRFFRFGLSSDTERFQRLLPASRNAGSGGTKPADLLQNV